MKSLLLTCLWTLCSCLISSLAAQVPLPYYSGFDNTVEQNGWAIYRLGESAIGNWSIAGINGFSAPSCISHDYSPSSGVNVVDDWYVSPGFELPAGGILDSVRYAFSGFSVPAAGDTIGVYLVVGDKDPAEASDIIKLAEFRDADYQADNVYRLLSGIPLPATNEMAFIGLRYRNAEASSRWLHVRFDNIAVSGLTTSVNIPYNPCTSVVYPNPAADVVTILYGGGEGIASLYDTRGTLLLKMPFLESQYSTTFSLSHFPQGIYHLVITRNNILETITIARS